jgi:transcriptional regulator with XRE-family HTH domain
MSTTVKSRGNQEALLGAQIRAARALLRWSAADLVRESGVSHATIHRAETVNGKTAMTFANATAIRRALEAAGVELVDENGGGQVLVSGSEYQIDLIIGSLLARNSTGRSRVRICRDELHPRGVQRERPNVTAMHNRNNRSPRYLFFW